MKYLYCSKISGRESIRVGPQDLVNKLVLDFLFKSNVGKVQREVKNIIVEAISICVH
jgi:hypothetical protein